MAGWETGDGQRQILAGDGPPSVAVVVIRSSADDEPALSRTLQSVQDQHDPQLELVQVVVDPGAAALADAVAALRTEFLVVLRAGDTLAPGALAATALAGRWAKADAVIGMRVVLGPNTRHLDMLAGSRGRLRVEDAAAAVRPVPGLAPFTGGEILLRREAVLQAGSLSSNPPGASASWVSELWPKLAEIGIRVVRIGRPVLVQHENQDFPQGPRRSLTIVALNDAGASGGAGIAHRRLSDALRLAGHAVATHTLNTESPAVAAEWTDRFPRTEQAIAAEKPDLVLLGNIHGATRTGGLFRALAGSAPTLAVLHDLFALTGRCAHPAGCERIAHGCDALCPTPTLYPQLDPARIATVFRDKRDALSGAGAPVLVANSDWAEQQARSLAPPGARVARIDLPFPTQVFRPGNKAELRRRLGLPEAGTLILFAAVIADQPDKGAADLAAALARVAGPGIGFVALGRIDDPLSFPLPNLYAPGPIGAEEELAAWYGACDLHVTASRLETLGQTPIEAGLCGVPTVAYRNTGLTTAVIDGVSGLLVDPNPDALARGVRDLLADQNRLRRLSLEGRIALENRNSHAAAYLDLHEILVDLGLQPDASAAPRVSMTAETLDTFSFSPTPRPGARGTVHRPSNQVVRVARRWKQRIWGRTQPLWMRRGLYAVYLVRRRLRAVSGKAEPA